MALRWQNHGTCFLFCRLTVGICRYFKLTMIHDVCALKVFISKAFPYVLVAKFICSNSYLILHTSSLSFLSTCLGNPLSTFWISPLNFCHNSRTSLSILWISSLTPWINPEFFAHFLNFLKYFLTLPNFFTDLLRYTCDFLDLFRNSILQINLFLIMFDFLFIKPLEQFPFLLISYLFLFFFLLFLLSFKYSRIPSDSIFIKVFTMQLLVGFQNNSLLVPFLPLLLANITPSSVSGTHSTITVFFIKFTLNQWYYQNTLYNLKHGYIISHHTSFQISLKYVG